jgi:hypothetical protein
MTLILNCGIFCLLNDNPDDKFTPFSRRHESDKYSVSYLTFVGPCISNKNEYQEYFLGGKGIRCVGLTTLPASGADCLEI